MKDMSRTQFQTALKRNGFEQIATPLGIYFKDTTGQLPNTELGGRYYTDCFPWKFARRDTLAYILQYREKHGKPIA